MIRDAWQLGDERPLILAGGPKAIFEPWDLFGLSPDGTEGADVVVTGEEFVILEFLNRVECHKLPGESMRTALRTSARRGALGRCTRLGLSARCGGTARPSIWSTRAFSD